LRRELEEQSASLGLGDKVRFLGRRDDVPAVLSSLDLFVMTSHMEGLCTSILDAMSADVPVVATNAGGIPEIVRDGETGLLAANKDPHGIASAIIAARRDSDAAERRVKRAREMVSDEFGLDNMIRSTAELYGRLTGEAPPSDAFGGCK
jgi:L-malate glycosyltransferase